VAAGDDVSLRDHFEALFAEHQRAHRAEQDATQRALTEARNTMEYRLSGLNELRREYTQDRDQLVKADVFEARMEQLVLEDRRVAAELQALRRDRDRDKGRNAALAAVGGVLLIVVPIVMQLIDFGKP